MQIKKVLMALVAFLCICMNATSVYAVDDGAYISGRSTSYVNPLTGVTQDGGSNIALGDSMVGSIVENELLVEQVNGTYYVTIGLGLASNVSNVRFQIMTSNGSMYATNAAITGSSTANGDSVHHYRIQMNSLGDYISPILYVNPMGRDVQFFIQIQTSTMKPGKGIYQSLMIPASETKETETPPVNANNSNNEKKEANKESEETKGITNNEDVTESNLTEENMVKEDIDMVETVNKEMLFKDVEGLSLHTIKQETGQKSYTLYIIIGVLIILIAGVKGGWYYVKKSKK